jgi:hypothetical protein
MADEYTWHGDADLDTSDLRTFITAATGGEQHQDGTIFLMGMYITASHVAGDDINPVIGLFGFDGRFRATFRYSARADEATTAHAVALMVHTVVAFWNRYGGHGVLLFNGEIAVLQYGDGEMILDAEWEDWFDNSEVAPLRTQFASRVLAQPLL